MSEPQLPTEADIYKLPCRARVAFAARCARQASPLFKKNWPEAPEGHLIAIEKAVSKAEQSAAAAAAADAFGVAAIAVATADAVAAADAVSKAAKADAAFADITKAAYASSARARASSTRAAAVAAGATAAAFEFAFYYSIKIADAVVAAVAIAGVPIAAIAHDFQTILELSQREKWTDDTPVPPSVFGPIVNDVVGKLKPITPSTGHVVEIELEIPDHWTEQQIRDHVAELTHRAEMVHRAAGGNGLTVEEMRIENEQPAYVPVGSK